MPQTFPEQLTYEDEIIWLEDVSGCDYVREWLLDFRQRRNRPSWRGLEGRLVGYAVLRGDAPRGPFGFQRRCFFLKEHDRDRSPADTYHAARAGGSSGGCPMEGVDPLTVAVGVPGVQNARAWGGPLPAG
jgi:hypothetical protein